MSGFRASSIGIVTITASKRSRCVALIACASSISSLAPVAAAPRSAVTETRTMLRALQAADLRVTSIAYRLAVSGAPICPRKSRLTGLTLHHVGQYAPGLRAAVRATFALGDAVAVLAVAPGSPAERAGIRADDSLLAVDGVPLAPNVTEQARYAEVEQAYHRVERAAAPIPLQLARGGRPFTARLTPVEGCASRVQLLTTRRIAAKADGINLTVTNGLLAFVRDDGELALAIAHEMAHNALGHRDALRSAAFHRGRKARIRATEAEADRLAYFLMARAGFSLDSAPRFWSRLYAGPARYAVKTHPPAAERIALAQRTALEIENIRAQGKPLTP